MNSRIQIRNMLHETFVAGPALHADDVLLRATIKVHILAEGRWFYAEG